MGKQEKTQWIVTYKDWANEIKKIRIRAKEENSVRSWFVQNIKYQELISVKKTA